jgi:hypothetical protein
VEWWLMDHNRTSTRCRLQRVFFIYGYGSWLAQWDVVGTFLKD